MPVPPLRLESPGEHLKNLAFWAGEVVGRFNFFNLLLKICFEDPVLFIYFGCMGSRGILVPQPAMF